MNHALRSLLSDCRRDLELTSFLRAARLRSGAALELLEDLEAQLERSNQAAVVTLVGSTGAGKSSLLNALVRSDVAQPGTTRPTTSAPVIYAPRDADLASLLEGLPGARPRVETYSADDGKGPAGPWTAQILIDAPDTNSVAEEHRDVVRALAERSDVLVLVAHRQSIAELAAVSFVDAFAARRGLMLVLGRADELDADTQRALVAQLEALAAERWGLSAPVHVVSPLLARQDPSEPAWRALEEELEQLVAGGRLGHVRRHNALGTLSELQALSRDVQKEAAGDLAAVETELRAGLDAWKDGVGHAVHERLALRGPELAHLLWNEVGRRWDGPGGLAVRAGGLSALGLGAGAMLARRNPVLAAGAAVTAVAADRARGALQERSFQDASGLVPGAVELHELDRKCLGPARLAALQAGGEQLGVHAERLGPAAATAVGEAWANLTERDLPAQAAKSAGPLLRLVIDLPIYAFGLWIVYCAGRGFVTGDYVGMDFLVNAALLAGAWLFLARGIVRSSLRHRAEGLLSGVGGQIDAQLESMAHVLAEPIEEAIAEQRQALERLGDVEERASARLRGLGHSESS